MCTYGAWTFPILLENRFEQIDVLRRKIGKRRCRVTQVSAGGQGAVSGGPASQDRCCGLNSVPTAVTRTSARGEVGGRALKR